MPTRTTEKQKSSAITFTLRHPPYAYLHLKLVTRIPSPNSSTPVDEITIRAHCNSAMQQQFGLTGTAVPIDVLKVQGQEAWVRVPKEDESALVSALSQWGGQAGIMVRGLGRGSWLGGLDSDSEWEGKLWTLES